MKKLIGILILAMVIGCFAAGVSSAVTELSSTISATVGTIFSLEFYTEAGKVLYSTAVPFSTVDPSSAFNYADDRAEFDLKSDVGLIVKSNQAVAWYLKINVNAASGLAGKLGAYMGQPFNRNWETDADGGLTYGDWFPIPTTATTIYTAGPVGDYTNTPSGTLATLSFKIDGTGLAPGAYSATVTYTLTTTP